MEGISEYRRPGAIVVQQQQARPNPWESLAPDLMKAIVGGMVMAKLKQKLETDPQYQQQEKIEKLKGDRLEKIELMKEAAASGRQDKATRISQLLNGWREGPDGQLMPPQSGAAPSNMPQVPGKTWVMQDGKVALVDNNPTVALELPPNEYGQRTTIPGVSPNTAATIGGHIYTSGANKKPDYSVDKVVDDTEKHYSEQAKAIDTKYGTSNAFGQFSIDDKVRGAWEKEREELYRRRLSDQALVSQGKKPSWMTYEAPDPNGPVINKHVTDFINSFNFKTME